MGFVVLVFKINKVKLGCLVYDRNCCFFREVKLSVIKVYGGVVCIVVFSYDG